VRALSSAVRAPDS